MSEKDMRGKVVKALRELDAFAVENPCLPGTPDVNYIGGWLELKWLRSWPKKEETIVKIPHYSPQQKMFHRTRRMKGGAMYVLLQCKREWFVIDGIVAAEHLGECSRNFIKIMSVRWTPKGFNDLNLLDFLKEGR